MDAKEKAKDLILKFSILKDGHNHLVKQCALLTVDEIMSAIGWNEMEPEDRDTYWDDVKYQIEIYK